MEGQEVRIATVALAASLALAAWLGLAQSEQADARQPSQRVGTESQHGGERSMSDGNGDGGEHALRVVQAQARRGNEFVGVPRFEPPAGWQEIGSRTVAHASGEGRLSADIHGRSFRRLHLIANGNSILIASVQIVGRSGSPHVVRLAHDLQTG